MKSLTFITTALLICCFANPTIAQQAKKKGYVLLNNSDTLHGWIHYKNWEENPRQILFQKDSLNDSPRSFTINDLTCFEIAGFDKYVKAVIEKDIRPVDLNNLLRGYENKSITDTVFLRQIVSGSIINLYELVDSKYHFYIKDAVGPFKELSYKVFLNEEKDMVSQKNYINQLKSVIGEDKMTLPVENKINRAAYKEKDLKAAVIAINKTTGSVYYSAGEKGNARMKSSFFAGIGGGYSSLQFKGTQAYMDKMSYTGGFTPYVMLGMEVAEQRNFQSLFMRIELVWYSVNYKGSGTIPPTLTDTDDQILKYQLSQRNISPSLSVFYNFVNKETYKVYAGLGIAYNFSSYPENKVTIIKQGNHSKDFDNYIVPAKSWINTSAKLGLRVSRRWDVGLNADIYGVFTNYLTFSLTPHPYSAQLRYFFM